MRRLVALCGVLAVIGAGTAVALASHGKTARPALPPGPPGRAAGDRVHRRAADPGGARLALGAPRVAHCHLAVLARARGRTAPSAITTQTRSRAAWPRAVPPCSPSCGIPAGASRACSAVRRSRKHAARRLAVMLRALGAQGVVLDLGDVPAADRATLPAFLRDLREGMPASARLMLVIPPITDAASARAHAGYDLRDLSRPAVLVLRAWSPQTVGQAPHPIAALGWYKRTLRYTLAHAPRSRVIVALPTWGALWGPHGVARRTQAELFRLARPAALEQPAGARSRAGRRGRLGRVGSLAAAEARGRARRAGRGRRALGARRRVGGRLARAPARAAYALRICAGGSSSSSPARTSSPHSRQRQAVGGTRPPQPTWAAR